MKTDHKLQTPESKKKNRLEKRIRVMVPLEHFCAQSISCTD